MEYHTESPSASSKSQIDSPSEVQTRNWCDLPENVLFRIAICLDWRSNLGRLRGVCPQWRSKLPDFKFPTIISLPVPPIKPNLPNDLVLLLHRFYLLSPQQCATATANDDNDPLGGRWLARMADMGTNKKHLSNPLNIHEYFFSSPYISASIDPLDCQIQELHSVFSLISGSQTKAEPLSEKTVHTFNLDSAYQFAVLAQLEGKNGGGLFLYRLTDTQWIEIQESNNLRILDIACHKHKFYAFDVSSWRVGSIDPANPLVDMEFISAPGILGDPKDNKYTVIFDDCLYFFINCHLVPTDGELFLVVEVKKVSDDSGKKVSMIVFVLKQGNEEGYRWERVNSLKDQIFFIGYDVSFALPSASTNLPQWKPNSICLFTWPFPMMFDGCWEDGYGTMPEGVEVLSSVTYARYWLYLSMFSLEDEDEGLVPFEKLPKRMYTGLFFPPPAWVKWSCPSLDNLDVRLDRLTFVDLGDRPFDD